MTRPTEPSDAIWTWQNERRAEDSQAGAVRAAHRRGLLGGAVGLAAASVVWLALARPVAAVVLAGIALSVTAIAWLWPLTLHQTITRGLDRLARAVATAVTWVLMTLLFYLVFLPLGLLLRAAGKLGVTRRPDRRLDSYWTDVSQRSPTLESYRRQF
jgi:hypothetical protein